MFLRNPHLNGETIYKEGPQEVGILLLHGFTATPVETSYLANFFHERGYTVSAPLLPGHNTTPDDLNKQHWKDWVNTAEAAYAALQRRHKKVFVGGESMGAMLTLYLASQHPEIIGLALYAPALITPAKYWRIKILSWFKTYLPKPVRAPSLTDTRTKAYTVNPLKAVVQFLDLQKIVRPLLPRIMQPLLIIQGRLDTVINPRNGEIIMAEVHSAVKEFYWFEKSSHVLILDAEWEQAAETTLEFLRRISKF